MAEGTTSSSSAPEAPATRCKGKLCLAKGMIWVALALVIAAIVTPNWTHTASTVHVLAPTNTNSDPEQTQPAVNPDENSDADGPMPPPPPPPHPDGEDGEHGHGEHGEHGEHGGHGEHGEHGEHGHHRHHPDGPFADILASARSPIVLSDNSTLLSFTAHTGLWRSCVNGHCYKMRCCNKHKGSPACGSSKASGVTLILGAVLTVVSLLFLCCQSRGNFAGSRKAYIAPFLLTAVLALVIASLVLAHKTRRQQIRIGAAALFWRPEHSGTDNGPAPTVESVLHDVQFGSSFYMAVTGLSLLVFAWLSVLCNSCHERRAPRVAAEPCEGRRCGRRWFCRRSESRV